MNLWSFIIVNVTKALENDIEVESGFEGRQKMKPSLATTIIWHPHLTQRLKISQKATHNVSIGIVKLVFR